MLVGGYTCAITSATVDTIKCITAPVDGTIREALESAVVANANEVKVATAWFNYDVIVYSINCPLLL